MSFVTIDWIFLAVILLSAISVMIKGFVNELFSKITFVMGLFCSFAFASRFVPYVMAYVKYKFFAYIISFLLIFVTVAIVVQLIRSLIDWIFENGIMKQVDRILGFCLGILEGMVICFLILFILSVQPVFDVSGILNHSWFYSFYLSFVGNDFFKIKQSVSGGINV